MKCCVLGSGGYIGRNLTRRLVSQNLLGIDFNRSFNLNDINIVKACLEQAAELKCDIIFQAADISPNADNPRTEDYYNLIKLHETIIDAWIDMPQKIKFISFGSPWAYCADESVLKEKDYMTGNLLPFGEAYASNKRWLHQKLMTFRDKGYNCQTLVLGNTFGGDDNSKRLINKIIKSIRDGGDLNLRRTNSIRSYTHIDDIVQNIIEASTTNIPLLNVGGVHNMSVSDIVSTIINVHGYNGKISYDSSSINDNSRILNVDLFRKNCIEILTPFELCVRKCL